MKKETFEKIDDIFCSLFITLVIFLLFASCWVTLEEVIYGEAQNRVVDNIICVPVIYSFYLNSKYILHKHTKK